jgi:flagellar hook-basal body complex protein FliE
MANMTIENIGGFLKSGGTESITDRSRIESPQAEIPGEAVGNKSFSEMINESIDKVNEIQLQADRGVKEMAAGRNKNIHETMLLLEKADMSFKLMMQVRNKVIDAYREIIRMQV